MTWRGKQKVGKKKKLVLTWEQAALGCVDDLQTSAGDAKSVFFLFSFYRELAHRHDTRSGGEILRRSGLMVLK